ncbi:MAG TPA: hypothetical protein VHR86_06575 [Armatimonadota bacterium]|nr:hypothetical protein [Armatimonadota bacterium]
MEAQKWQALYRCMEEEAQAFFTLFSEVCICCYQVSEANGSPSDNCCRRCNFVPEICADPLLNALATASGGIAVLSAINGPGCAALGEQGCVLPFGRTPTCYRYVCAYFYRSASTALPPGLMYRIEQALEVFHLVRCSAARGDMPGYAACAVQVDAVIALLRTAAQSLRENAAAFATRKALVIEDMRTPAAKHH